MGEVGIRQFRRNVSAYIDRVAAGEVLTLTKHGRVVAHVVPADSSRGLSDLLSEGRLAWTGTKPRLPRPGQLKGRGPTMADYVAEGRR